MSRIILTLAALAAGVARTEAEAAVEIIAHRGASYDAPENTLASVKLGWEQNADAVEIDIYLTSDGKVVAHHDKTTKKIGGPDVDVAAQTLAELQKHDAGAWKNERYRGERIPTLASILETIPDGKRLFIEIKCGAEVLPELRRVIDASGKKPEQMALIGFGYETMAAAKKEFPKHEVFWVVNVKQDEQTGVWAPARDELIEQALAAGLDGLDLSARPIMDREYIDAVKAKGLSFCVWTVNDPAEARRLRDAGVEGITTDRPAFLRDALESPTAAEAKASTR